MSAAQHTPGPWFYGVAHEPEAGAKPFSYTGPGYYENPGILAPNGDTIVGCDEYNVFGDNEADKRLIVAAPELLEAGEGVLARMFDRLSSGNGVEADDGEKCWIVHSDDIEALRRAIAKARGDA